MRKELPCTFFISICFIETTVSIAQWQAVLQTVSYLTSLLFIPTRHK